MLSPGAEYESNGRLKRFPKRDVLSGDGICTRGRAGKGGVWSSATKDLNSLGDKVVTELLVKEAATIASVENELAGGRIHAGQCKQVRVLAPALQIGILISS